jgi:hypothetical protein
MVDLDPFFAYAIEREKIRIRREGLRLPRPWTEDPILQKYHFCNVFREDDRTTQWFRKHVRDPLRSRPEVLLATVLFRWFNRISTGEAIFCQEGIYHSGQRTAWEEFLRILRERGEVKTSVLRHAIVSYVGERGPFVTGAYLINTHACDGMSKLDGVLTQFGWFSETAWEGLAESMLKAVVLPSTWGGESYGSWSLEQAWENLRWERGLGPFMAYEIVTDLYRTDLLMLAPDAYTWANPGPGAKRGLDRIHGRDIRKSVPRAQLIEEMQEILVAAQAGYWPTAQLWVEKGDLEVPVYVSRWTMREVEHTLCEFDKYERARLGQGRPRGVLR